MEELWSKFDANPLSYENPSEKLRRKTLKGLKVLFDFYQKLAREDLRDLSTLGECKPISTGPLTELYTEGLDNDQVWEQIQLVNELVIKGATPLASSMAETFRKGKFQLLPHSIPDRIRKKTVDRKGRSGLIGRDKSIDGASGSEEVELSGEELEENDEPQGRKAIVSGRKSVVDDRFFKLYEMEKFLEMAEKEEAAKLDGVDKAQSDEEEGSEDEDAIDVDYFQDLSSGEDEGGEGAEEAREAARYEDFFDPPIVDDSRKEEEEGNGRTVRFADEELDGAVDSEADGEGDELEDGEEVEFDDDTWQDDEEGGDDEEEDDDEEGGDDEEEDDDEEDDGEGGDDEEDENRDGMSGGDGELKELSKHERKQLLMKQKISALEKVNLSEKAWQMSGESTAKKRPMNSLLEEDLSVDIASRPAPVITEEVTKSLEDIIKQRIRDEAWDDVERRIKPVEKPFDYSKSRPLDQEKSKMSLAEVYEQEYVKQTQEAGLDKEDERHTEIQEMMGKLFVKLDALSNFHFTPKPLKSEVQIVTNVAALQMEEVAPVATSDAQLLAPEELQAKSRHPEVGDSEKTATDKRRERRDKKKRKRGQETEKRQREKLVSKIRPGLGNKYSKKSLEKKMKLRQEGEKVDKSLRSSQFFARLQDEVKEQVKNVQGQGKNYENKKKMTTAQQYKL